MSFKGIYYLELWRPPFFGSPKPFVNSCRGHFEENIWTSGSGDANFLSRALVPLLFNGAEPFVQFWLRASYGTFL